MTPNARTREYYRKQGYIAEIVETYSPFPKPWGKRHDLLTIFDLIILKDGVCTGVQATSNNGGNLSARVKKMVEAPQLAAWLSAGGQALAIGWSKQGPRGKAKRWTPREVPIDQTTIREFAQKDLLAVPGDTGVVQSPDEDPPRKRSNPAGRLGRVGVKAQETQPQGGEGLDGTGKEDVPSS